MKQLHLGVVLLLSLLLNAFLLGVVVSSPDLRFGFHHFTPEDRMAQGLGALPPGPRETVRALLDQNRAAAEGRMREMRDLFRQIQPTLTAAHFDADALRDLFRRIDATDLALKQAMATTLMTIATTLPDHDRQQFFRHMPPVGPGGGPGGAPPPEELPPPDAPPPAEGTP